MRIISGSARGRTLATPKDQSVRPTTDRVRESLFSILGSLHELVVLDAFAGTGALGCEALSRGAAFCYFFDPSKDSMALIKENISRVKATARASTQQQLMTQALPTITQHKLDLVFLDPPYHTALANEALQALATHHRLLAPAAIIVLEQAIEDPQPAPPSSRFALDDLRTYGRTRLTFFRHISSPEIDDLQGA